MSTTGQSHESILADNVASGRSALAGWPLVTAIAAFVSYAALIIVMVLSRNSEEVAWSRLVYIFASIQALAFAAAGALWGTTVNQARAEKAESAAEQNSRDASNGRALAAAITADTLVETPVDQDRNVRGNVPRFEDSQSVASRHAAIAARLFPAQATLKVE